MIDLHASSGIGNASLLQGLSKAQRSKLAEIGREVKTEPGDHLVTQGQTAEALYIAASGEYALTIGLLVAGDVRHTQIERKVPGDAFGWSALIKPHRSQYSVTCMAAGSVVAFSRDELFQLFAADPTLGTALLGNVGELVGKRLALMQRLWIEEVEQSMVRVKHWLEHTIDG